LPGFLLLHGLDGSGPDHWQHWLADRLVADGADVRFPDLPDAADPAPGVWDRAVRAELEAAGPECVVLCHSLACLTWLRVASVSDRRLAARVALVAPPHTTEVPAVVRFKLARLAPKAVHRAAGETRIVWAPDDPYCPGGAAKSFGAPLRMTGDRIERGGHLNTDSGYGPWPGIEAWARGQARAVAAG
jgi:predicted alpha/beta hydrolase family esterase